METTDKEEFRLMFCKAAADLGLKPSEFLSYVKYAKVCSNNVKTAGWKDYLLTGGKNLSWLGIMAPLVGGASLGALAAYGVNKGERSIDPTGELLSDEADSVGEAKKLQLLAKYRNAIDRLNSDKTVD